MATIATISASAPKSRNMVAAGLHAGQYRKQIVRPKAGKGSYSRKPKHGKAGW